MNGKAIINKAIAHLEKNTGIRAVLKQHRANKDGKLELRWNGHVLHAFLEVRNELRAYQVDQIIHQTGQHQPYMIVATHIFPTLKEMLRENRIGYLDTAGNIYLPDKDHFIWIEGNKPVKEEKPATNRAFTKAGLRTVFYLLLNKQAIDLPYRELAMTTGVALGNINNIITGLKDAGFILQLDAKKIQLQNKKALLERWMVAYYETLKPTLHIATYRYWKEENFEKRDRMLENAPELVWGGEPAAEKLTNYLNPQILTLYTKENLKDEWANKWGLVPDNNGNIRIYQKFWQDTEWDVKKLTPPILVYADLMMTHDPRCIETAHIIYDKYIRHELE
jgi:hypothetical protein